MKVTLEKKQIRIGFDSMSIHYVSLCCRLHQLVKPTRYRPSRLGRLRNWKLFYFVALLNFGVSCSKSPSGSSQKGKPDSPATSLLKQGDYSNQSTLDPAALLGINSQMEVISDLSFAGDLLRVQFILNQANQLKIFYDKFIPGNGYEDRPFILAIQQGFDVPFCDLRRNTNLEAVRVQFQSPAEPNTLIYGLGLTYRLKDAFLPGRSKFLLRFRAEGNREWTHPASESSFTLRCGEIIAAKASVEDCQRINTNKCGPDGTRSLSVVGANRVLEGWLRLLP